MTLDEIDDSELGAVTGGAQSWDWRRTARAAWDGLSFPFNAAQAKTEKHLGPTWGRAVGAVAGGFASLGAPATAVASVMDDAALQQLQLPEMRLDRTAVRRIERVK